MVYKRFGMVDVVMDKTADARLVIVAQAIHVNNAVRHDFLFDNRQSIGLGIIYGNDIDPSVTFQNAEDDKLPLMHRDCACSCSVRRNSFYPFRSNKWYNFEFAKTPKNLTAL